MGREHELEDRKRSRGGLEKQLPFDGLISTTPKRQKKNTRKGKV